MYAQGTLVYWLLSGEKPQEGAGAPLLAIAAEWRDLVKQCVCAEAKTVRETLERVQRLPVVQSTRPGLETLAATHARQPSAPHTRPASASAQHPPIKRGTRALSAIGEGEMRQEIKHDGSINTYCCALCSCLSYGLANTATRRRRWQRAARRDPRVVERRGRAREAGRAGADARDARRPVTLRERIRIDRPTWLWCLRIGVQGNVH